MPLDLYYFKTELKDTASFIDVAGNQTEEDGVLPRCGWEPN